jgi:hypothetical protein
VANDLEITNAIVLLDAALRTRSRFSLHGSKSGLPEDGGYSSTILGWTCGMLC